MRPNLGQSQVPGSLPRPQPSVPCQVSCAQHPSQRRLHPAFVPEQGPCVALCLDRLLQGSGCSSSPKQPAPDVFAAFRGLLQTLVAADEDDEGFVTETCAIEGCVQHSLASASQLELLNEMASEGMVEYRAFVEALRAHLHPNMSPVYALVPASNKIPQPRLDVDRLRRKCSLNDPENTGLVQTHKLKAICRNSGVQAAVVTDLLAQFDGAAEVNYDQFIDLLQSKPDAPPSPAARSRSQNQDSPSPKRSPKGRSKPTTGFKEACLKDALEKKYSKLVEVLSERDQKKSGLASQQELVSLCTNFNIPAKRVITLFRLAHQDDDLTAYPSQDQDLIQCQAWLRKAFEPYSQQGDPAPRLPYEEVAKALKLLDWFNRPELREQSLHEIHRMARVVEINQTLRGPTPANRATAPQIRTPGKTRKSASLANSPVPSAASPKIRRSPKGSSPATPIPPVLVYPASGLDISPSPVLTAPLTPVPSPTVLSPSVKSWLPSWMTPRSSPVCEFSGDNSAHSSPSKMVARLAGQSGTRTSRSTPGYK
eukprot:TRINITY_DN8705_c0_g1_i14.p1 TRINITY_DN8705_c0_g1~~TRINITY_DN8705_c0_g1_i14.p1  ORF type:complete len:538 (+),score=74.35 TRINITY_DN8705_c0_g1_i14:748-2361(+)